MCEGSYYYPVCQFSWQLLSRWCDDDVSGLAMLLLHQPLGPLRRPPPRHPMTNYFLFVTETQSSEGRGIFCSLSHQPNLTLFPPVGHSLTGSLFLSSLIGDIGRQWGSCFISFVGFWFAKQSRVEATGPVPGPLGVVCTSMGSCPWQHAVAFISILLREPSKCAACPWVMHKVINVSAFGNL